MLLDARDLSVSRGGLPVLADLTFGLDAGEALLVKGPNGAGKTTLLRTLAGLQPPYAGSVSPGPEEIAYAGHMNGVKATLSVAENLAFWAGIYGTRDIGAAMDAFALAGLEDRAAQHLSAGQARRLGLARLLVTRRPIWILDEPTVSLDTAGVKRFADVVKGHLADGGAAVIATHVDAGLDARVLDLSRYRARVEQGIFG